MSKGVRNPSNELGQPVRANLSKRYIDGLQKSADRAIHWDLSLKGFGLLHLPSGVKTFIFDSRSADARKRRYTSGRFGALTVEQARDRSPHPGGARGTRTGPGGGRAQAVGSADGFRIARRLYREACRGGERVEDAPLGQSRRSSCISGRRSATLKVASVTRQDVLKLSRRMEATPRQANLTLAILSKAFSLAEEWACGRKASNPCKRVPRYEENERERFLSHDELARLGEAIVEAETIGLPWRENESAKAKHRPKAGEAAHHAQRPRAGGDQAALADRRRACRRSSCCAGMMSIFERGTAALPSKKGATRRPHPIGTSALAILAELPRIEGSPWVLPAPLDPEASLSTSVVSHA